MDRPSSLRPHTHSFESLETRQMLSGITGWDDVPLEQKDIAAAIADLMSKSGQTALGDEGLTTLRNELMQNDAFASILDTTCVFEKEQQEFGVANAKTKMMSDHITEETARKTRLGEELTQKSTLLAEAQTLLRSCESVESGLMTEQQRLTTLITDLRTELQQIPAQITALNQQITADQKKLNTTIRERRTAERSLLQCQTSYDRMIVLRDRYAGLLTQKPQNKTYQRAYEQTLKNMATYETRMQTYGMTIERCTATETDLNAALSANRGEVSHLKERRTALPAEIQSAKDQKTTIQAELTGNRAEQERLQTEIAGRQSAVDAAFAADAQAAAHLTQDESDLTALLAQEQAERADVEAIVTMVDNAIAQVLAEGDPPLPEIEEPEPAPVLLSESAHLAEGAVSSGMWTAELAGLGGTVTLQAWRGDAAPGTGIETIRGTDILQTVIASELTAQKLAANPTLASQLGIAAGPAPYQQGSGYAVEFVAEHPSESVGRVTVITDSPTSRNPRYILNTQGVLAPTRLGIDSKGKLVCSNVGQGAVSLVFPDGPQYVQWLDVRYLGGSVGGSILATTASGEWKQICALGGSGAYIINETIQNLCILPTDDTSAYGLRSVEFARPQADAAEDAVWLRARGELVGIDLHNAGKAVSAVDLSLLSDRPGTRITAVAYRGETEVARADISADGTVHLEDVAGFTGVFLLKEEPSSVIAIRSMQVTGWDNTVAPAGDAPTIMNNRLVAEQNHPQWEHGTFNYIDVARQSGVHFSRGGYEDTVNGGVLHQPGSETSTTQYTRYDVRSMNGNVHISGLYYIDADGLHRVPADRWTSMGSSLIVAPGGPKYLVLQIAGNGTYEIGSSVADRATDITPSQEMQLRSTVLVVRPIGPAEGFCTVPAGVSSENAHATAGGSVNMFYQILNDGLGSGLITVRIHVGQSGTVEDPVVKTFSGQNLAGMASIGLSVNVTLQAERDQVSMEVIGPDGQSTFVSKLVRPEHGGNGYTEEQRNYIMTEGRGQWLARKIDDIVNNSTSPRMIAYREAVAAEKARIASLPPEEQATLIAEKEQEKEVIVEEIIVQLAKAGNVDLGEIPTSGKIGQQEIELEPSGNRSIQFTLATDMMVNLWVDMGENDPSKVDIVNSTLDFPDLSLTLNGGGISYASNRGMRSGESISSVLPAGTYTLTVRDLTQYSPASSDTVMPSIPVQMEMLPYKTQEIIGRVSIPERMETMPVSMRVAEFDPNTGLRLPEAKNALDPNKPVWVVVHGRKDNEGSANIGYLAQQLAQQGYQVVTVNWEDAARDNGPLLAALDGADWIPAVGKWVADQLKASGFTGDKILIPSHSWGSFVAYEIGRQFKEGQDGNGFGVQAIVALDSPLDLLPNHYPSSNVSFSEVSKTSWAIKSSAFGSESRANSAVVNFDLLTPSEELERNLMDLNVLSPGGKTALDLAEAYLYEHGYAVSYFANLIHGDGDSSLNTLAIDKLMNGENPDLVIDPYGPEGILSMTLREVDGTWQAVPTSLLSPQ